MATYSGESTEHSKPQDDRTAVSGLPVIDKKDQEKKNDEDTHPPSPKESQTMLTEAVSAADPVPDPVGRAYMINVVAYQNGVGYGAWTHVDGFSENVFRFIAQMDESKPRRPRGPTRRG